MFRERVSLGLLLNLKHDRKSARTNTHAHTLAFRDVYVIVFSYSETFLKFM